MQNKFMHGFMKNWQKNREMTNLSKALRKKLDQAYEIRKVKVVAHQISKVDPNRKIFV